MHDNALARVERHTAAALPWTHLTALLSAAFAAIRHALWHGRSIRAQLLMVFILIDVLAALIAGAVTIMKARTATRVEIAAGMKVAELLLSETLNTLREDVAPDALMRSLPLQLRFLRHVRILTTDASGTNIDVDSRPAIRKPEHRSAPALFAALIAPPPEQHELPVIVSGRRVGSVFVLGEPSDEIAEVWSNTVALAAVGAAVNCAVIAVLYVLFGRVLVPLTGVANGLRDLERQKPGVRLPRPQAAELAAITDRFNALAEALDGAQRKNAQLTRRLITAQDDERRHIALELHDEVGPCLFGLKASASSLQTAIAGSRCPERPQFKDRLAEVLQIIEHLQAMNRRLLNRLRPMALGHVPLKDLLAGLIRDRSQQHPQIGFAFACHQLKARYSDLIDLTLYRCVQESLTNAIRHAQAKHITVEVGEVEADAQRASGAQLRLRFGDDGRGIAREVPRGFGLSGMEERVRALGGEFRITTGPGGTSIEISLPLEAQGPTMLKTTADRTA